MPEDATDYERLPDESTRSDAPDENANAAPDAQQQRRYYWTMALLNLLETGAAAGVSKFTPLFLAARGLDVAQVGVVLAVAQVCRFLGGLVFGRVADKTGRFRGVLLLTNFVSVALALSTTSLLSPWHGMHGWKRVLVLALLTDSYAFFTSPSGTLIDAIAVVAQTSGGASYGSLRLWAAIGWGLAAVGMGAGVDRYGFSSVFIAYATGTGLSSALVVACFENPKKPRSDAAAAPASLASVFLVAPVPLYFLNFFVHGCLAAFVESYLLLFVATEWPATPNWYVIPPRHLADAVTVAISTQVPGPAHPHRGRVRDPCLSIRKSRHRPDRRASLSGGCAAALCVALRRLRDARAVRDIDARVPVVRGTGAVPCVDVRDDVVGSCRVRQAGRAAGAARDSSGTCPRRLLLPRRWDGLRYRRSRDSSARLRILVRARRGSDDCVGGTLGASPRLCLAAAPLRGLVAGGASRGAGWWCRELTLYCVY